MNGNTRNEFTEAQIWTALEVNAAAVVSRWRLEFSGKPAHYLCEECEFVSDQRIFFQVDHVVPCARGGTADRVSQEVLEAIEKGSVAALYQAGVNHRILCEGCNQAKKARQFIPPGSGFAYRRPQWDRNPDHLFHGPPTVSRRQIVEHPEPYDPRRYR